MFLNYYKELTKNEKTTASEVVPGSTVFLHIEEWGGSKEIKVDSLLVFENKTELTTEHGKCIAVPCNTPVWVREYEERKGLNIVYVISVFSWNPNTWKTIHSQDINKINNFVAKNKHAKNAAYWFEIIQQGKIVMGENGLIGEWVPANPSIVP